ncbi:cytochrome P450 4C1-like [Ischnura elegans]|uniref:cytochrome P450 4C1-like n=1 Tax=Ischnura elegans TaxID=197161 RepID=UPI001ED86D3F|nr:cytochrome P450 4C1-like [Ischnura elegans]
MDSNRVPVLEHLPDTFPSQHVSPSFLLSLFNLPPPSLSHPYALTLYTLAAVLAPYLIARMIRTAKLQWALRGVPGPPALPFVGNLILLTKGNWELYRLLRLANKIYGSMFQLWIGGRPCVFLFRAEVVKPLLNSPEHIDKSLEYRFLQPWLGRGLVTSTGDKWHARRKLLTNTMHKSVLEVFLSMMIQESDLLVKRLEAKIDSTPVEERGPGGWSQTFDMVPISKLSALDTTCKTIMGINIHEQSETEYMEYLEAINRLTSVLHQRFLTPWLRPDFLFSLSALGRDHDKCLRITRSFADKVIKERKEERAMQKMTADQEAGDESVPKVAARRKALLDLLLEMSENGENLSDQDIREEVDTFMFAGHDTISACVSWALYLFGHSPEIQDRAVHEIETVLGDKLDTNEITPGDLGLLTYLGYCIKETMRLFPPVPLMGRDLKTPLKINDHTLRPGTAVVVATYILHRDPKVFPEPEKFDPDRFIGPEAESRSPFAYTPFSAGSRNCIGQKFAMMEVKLWLAKVLRVFEFRSLDKRRELRLQGEIVLNNINGVRLSVRRRNHNNNITS